MSTLFQNQTNTFVLYHSVRFSRRTDTKFTRVSGFSGRDLLGYPACPGNLAKVASWAPYLNY